MVDNFVNVKDTGASTVASGVLSVAGGGTTAAAWGGVTPLQATVQAWRGHHDLVRVPGMVGVRTPLQWVGTAGASWLVNTVLIKGVYNAGLLVGSISRTAINRAAAAACTE